MARINLNPGKYNKKRSNFLKLYPNYNYSNTDAVEKLTTYIINPQKTDPECTCYYNVSPSNPKTVQDSFTAIQKIYGKEQGRHAEHFVVSFSKEESALLGKTGVINIAAAYCSTFADEYQLISAVHIEKPEQLHFHVEINPVNIRTGKRLHKDGKFLYTQRNLVQTLVAQELEKHTDVNRISDSYFKTC